MRSDYDEMHPFLGELLPAGHCLCHSSVAFECASCLDRQEGNSGNGNGNGSAGKNSGETDEKTWEFVYGRDDTNEALTRKQCQAAFPGAFEDVQRAVELRRKEGKNVRAQDVAGMKMYKGMVKAMIFNGEVGMRAFTSRSDGGIYLLDCFTDKVDAVVVRRRSTMHGRRPPEKGCRRPLLHLSRPDGDSHPAGATKYRIRVHHRGHGGRSVCAYLGTDSQDSRRAGMADAGLWILELESRWGRPIWTSRG